jgi:AhpD family alkylhydroperoxidase
VVPNMVRVMANSPAMLRGYLGLAGALDAGSLGGPLREQIALAVAEANGCDYCLSAHTALGAGTGLTESDIAAARRGTAADPKHAAALLLAVALVEGRGRGVDAELNRARVAGYTNGAIAEIVAEVALNILTNYFNILAQTEIDFPRAKPLAVAA